MKKFVTAIGVSALAVCALAAGGSAASADGDCADGYALTAGGVPEADVDGDGLTCERSTADAGATRFIALDNHASGPPSPCPEPFAPVVGYPRGEDPDRNENSVVCVRQLRTGDVLIIDDHSRRESTG